VLDETGCQLGLAGGLSTRARSHQIDNVEVWQRGNAFVMLSGGLAFSFPGADPSPEKTDALARGDGIPQPGETSRFARSMISKKLCFFGRPCGWAVAGGRLPKTWSKTSL